MGEPAAMREVSTLIMSSFCRLEMLRCRISEFLAASSSRRRLISEVGLRGVGVLVVQGTSITAPPISLSGEAR